MNVPMLPGAQYIMAFFALIILAVVSAFIGTLFLAAGQCVKGILWDQTRIGQMLEAGHPPKKLGLKNGKWPWWLTMKLSVSFGVVGFLLSFYAFFGPVMAWLGVWGG